MIAIVNIEEHARPTGLHLHEVRINQQVICTFQHWREESLATCLRKAAEAVDALSRSETSLHRPPNPRQP